MEDNLTVRWFQEVWNQRRRETIGELLASDGRIYEGTDVIVGPEAFGRYFDRIGSASSDVQITIEDSFIAGDKHCARWSATLLHDGPGFGCPRRTRP